MFQTHSFDVFEVREAVWMNAEELGVFHTWPKYMNLGTWDEEEEEVIRKSCFSLKNVSVSGNPLPDSYDSFSVTLSKREGV